MSKELELNKNENEIALKEITEFLPKKATIISAAETKKAKLAEVKKAKLSHKKDVIKKETKKDEKLTKINFETFASKVQNFTESSVSKAKSVIYNYPEKWTILEINSGEGKAWRNKRRIALINFVKLIGLYYKHQQSENLLKEIAIFDSWYKEYYKTNDYSVGSITHTTGEKNAYIVNMLDIIKLVKAS